MNAPDQKEPAIPLPPGLQQYEAELQAMEEPGEGDDPGELGDTSESPAASGTAA